MRGRGRGVQPVHRSKARRAKKGPLNLWRANLTSNTLLHSLIMFVTALYKVYVIWRFCCTGNKAFRKVYGWFYWTSILREVSACHRGPKSILFHLAPFLLEALTWELQSMKVLRIFALQMDYSDIESSNNRNTNATKPS